MSLTFLAIGECMIEMAPRDDGAFDLGFAGDTFNTAWYARKVGSAALKVSYLSAVGGDDASRQMQAFIKGEGIEPCLAIRSERSVGLYLITLDEGERSFSYWRSQSAARLLAEDLSALDALNPGDMAFFSGITLAILPDEGKARLLEGLAGARAKGVQVAFDPNLRPRLWPDTARMCDWIMKGAGVADIALPSFEDEASFFEDADINATAKRYRMAGAGLVVVKDGGDPVLIDSAGGRSSVAPEPVAAVIDTTAAGDSFNGQFLVSLLEGESAEIAAEKACRLSGAVIGARGALVDLDLF